MSSSYFTRLPLSTAVAPPSPPSPPSSVSRPASLSHRRSLVPRELQAAVSDLLSLHSQLDSALLRLDSCSSLSALSAASLEVKQRIAQLQQRIVAVQAELEQERHRHQQQQHSQSVDEPATAPITATRRSATTQAITPSADPYESVHRLLAHHSVLAGSYSNTLRQRLLGCRAQLAARSRNVRSELFASSAPPQSASASVASSSSASAVDRQLQFTASLHHSQSLLQSALSLSAASLDSLSASTDSLRSTQRHSAVHSEAVKGGSKLITKQMQRQRTDRLLVWLGLAFFLLVCLYITNRRLRISRILAFISRTLLPNTHAYSGDAARQQQQQQQQQHEQQHEHQWAGEW